VTLAALAALVYAGVIAYAATRVGSLAAVVATLGAFGMLLLAFVLVRAQDELLGSALGLAAIAYAAALVVHGPAVDAAAPLVGAGLLLCGELATWSLEERVRVAGDRSLLFARAAAVAALAGGGLAVSALVVSLAAAPFGGGLGWTVVGAAAAVLVLALAARAARS
jgi:hypothetical protein